MTASTLSAGMVAPDFTLPSTPDQKVRLSELRGRPVILAFYPADWSPVCGDQMALYNEMGEEFGRFKARLLGISVDGVWCHAAFARDRKLHFPLLADFEPKGEVARRYGVGPGSSTPIVSSMSARNSASSLARVAAAGPTAARVPTALSQR